MTIEQLRTLIKDINKDVKVKVVMSYQDQGGKITTRCFDITNVLLNQEHVLFDEECKQTDSHCTTLVLCV